MTIIHPNLTAVILAGGKGTRIDDEDKPLLKLGHQSLIEWVLEKIQPQVNRVMLSVNHNSARYSFLNMPVISDSAAKYSGPLAGIAAAMDALATNSANSPASSHALLCVPADVPFFPPTLVEELWREFESHPCDVVWCECENQVQPLFSIWSLACKQVLDKALAKGVYGPKLIMPELNNRLLRIDPTSPWDFLNINDTESLKTAQKAINSDKN